MKGYFVLKLLIKLNWRLSHFTTKTKVKGKCQPHQFGLKKLMGLVKVAVRFFSRRIKTKQSGLNQAEVFAVACS